MNRWWGADPRILAHDDHLDCLLFTVKGNVERIKDTHRASVHPNEPNHWGASNIPHDELANEEHPAGVASDPAPSEVYSKPEPSFHLTPDPIP